MSSPNSFPIIYKKNPSQKETKIIEEGILNEIKKIGTVKPDLQTFGFFIKNEKEEVIGGINGVSFHGSLLIRNLWVKPSYRKQGVGKKLLQEAERLAKQRGCSFVALSTFDFLGVLPFYQKQGYELEWTREGYDGDAKCFYLKKNV